MKNTDEVAVFWDYENCPVATNSSGYAVVNNIRSLAQTFGSVKLFKAYLEVSEQVPVFRAVLLRSELQSSGVSLTDCPHNGRKDVADKMILVDMLAHAIDNPAPSTIVLISGDRDFAYALSVLRLRRYRVVLITLANAHPSLRAQASLCFDWVSDILEPVDTTPSCQPPSPRRGKPFAPPVHDKYPSDPKGHNPSRYPFQESYDKKSTCNAMNYCQDEMRRSEASRAQKHDTRHDFLPPDMEQSKRQPATPSVASSALRNEPQSPARVIYSPVASSYHTCLNDNIETMSPNDSNSPRTTVISDMSAESTPTFAAYGSSKFSAYSSLGGSFSLHNLGQDEVAGVTESFESAVRIPSTEHGLRGSSPSPQQGACSQSQSRVDQVNAGGGNPDSRPAHSNIYSPANVTTPLSTSSVPPSSIPPSSLSNATASNVVQSVNEAASPLQPSSVPVVLDHFKILIQCLQSQRSKGILRPLRTNVALEIARNGTTYRKAGVSKFGDYVAIAHKAGIVDLGSGSGGSNVWIALTEPWYNVPLS